MQSVELSALRRKGDYYKNEAPDWVRIIWKRPESFDWFIKDNRDQLSRDGAIVKLGRDWYTHCDLFPAAAKKILGVEVSA